MRSIFLFSLLFYCRLSWSQCTVTICQACSHRDITVFYKDGNEGAESTKVNDSCTVYTIPIEAPHKVYIVDDSTRNIENLWDDIRYRKNRTVTIDHCTGQVIKHDTLPYDAEEALDMQITKDYQAGKIITQDSFVYYLNLHAEKYINAHPDSFLAVYYLKSLMRDIDIDKAIKYRDMVSKENNRYPEFKDIDSYIQNARYKSVPQVGDTFFEFQAKQTDGAIFDSKGISGKVVVLFFWYSGCGPCHRAMPALTELYNKYRSKGLEVISFSVDNNEEDWKKSTLAYKPAGTNVSDLVGFNSPLMLHYAVSSFPFFVVFDRSKKISMITFGNDEVPLVERKVEELIRVK